MFKVAVLYKHISCIDTVDIYVYMLYIYIYTTALPLSYTDGRYFNHISRTALFSGTNFY